MVDFSSHLRQPHKYISFITIDKDNGNDLHYGFWFYCSYTTFKNLIITIFISSKRAKQVVLNEMYLKTVTQFSEIL